MVKTAFFLLIASVFAFGNVAEFNVSCTSGYLFDVETPSVIHDDKLYISGREAYDSDYSQIYHEFAIDLKIGSCTAIATPYVNVDFKCDELSVLNYNVTTSYSISSNPCRMEMGSTGKGFEFTEDEFLFAYKQVRGDSSLTMKMTTGVAYEKDCFGGMYRNSLWESAVHFSLIGAFEDDLVKIYARESPGAEGSVIESSSTREDYLRIIRKGNVFYGYKNVDGSTSSWTNVGSLQLSNINDIMYVGLAGAACKDTVTEAHGDFNDIFFDGHVLGDDHRNYLIPATAEFSPVPFILANDDNSLYYLDPTSGGFNFKTSIEGLDKDIRNVYTYTNFDNKKCAWFFVGESQVQYLIQSYKTGTFGDISTASYTDNFDPNLGVVDDENGFVYLGATTKGLIVINAKKLTSILTYEDFLYPGFFLLNSVKMSCADIKSELLTQYGPFALGYVFPGDGGDTTSGDVLFGKYGEPTMVYADNAWTGQPEGSSYSAVYLASYRYERASISFHVTSKSNPIDLIEKYSSTMPGYILNHVDAFNNFGAYFSFKGVADTGFDNLGEELATISFSLYNCSQYNTCSSCIEDPHYCGWCVPEQVCKSFNQTCGTGEGSEKLFSFSRRLGCPVLEDIEPSLIPKLTDAALNVSGVLYADEIDGITCSIEGGANMTTSNKSTTNLQCQSGALSLGTHKLRLFIGTEAYGDGEVTISVFDCAAFDNCSQCLTVKGCVWSYRESVCEGETAVIVKGLPYASDEGLCPVVNGSMPQSGQDTGGYYVNVTGGPFYKPLEGSYRCMFDERDGTNVVNTTGIRDSQSSVRCQVPAVSIGVEDTWYDVKLYLEKNATNFYAEDSFGFLYYSCNNSNSCALCISEFKPDCIWCLSTTQCTGNETSCPESLYANGTCPTVTSSNPENVFYAIARDVKLYGASFPDPGALHGYSAEFNGTLEQANFTVDWYNTTSMTMRSAMLPQSDIGPLTVLLDNVTEIGTLDQFTFYGCSQFNYCSECVSGYDDCGWCYGSGCSYKEDPCTGTIFNTSCPILFSITPDMGHVDVNMSVIIAGSYFPDGMNFSLLFQSKSSSWEAYSENCTRLDSSKLNCTVVSSGDDIVAAVYVLADGDKFVLNSTLEYTYTYCGYFVTCSDCLQLVNECAYCHFGKCVEIAEVETECAAGENISTCPGPGTAVPYMIPYTGASSVVLRGDFYLPYPYSAVVSCRIGSSYMAGSITGKSNITCSNLGAYSGSLDVAPHFKEKLLEVYINGKLFTSAYILYYKCGVSSLSTACGQCINRTLSSDACGYCYDNWECTDYLGCSNPASFVNTTCPDIAHKSFSYYSGREPAEMTVTGTNFPTFVSSGVSCNFGVNSTVATVDSSTTLRCLTPRNAAQTQVAESLDLFIGLDGRQYTETPSSFELLDCSLGTVSTDPKCSLCNIADSRCGWCNNIANTSDACVTEAICDDVSVWANSTSTCPQVLGIGERVFSVSGGEFLWVTGEMMFNTSLMRCRFSRLSRIYYVDTMFTFFNSTTAYCVTPQWTLEQAGRVESVYLTILYANRSLYEGYEDTVSFVPLPKEPGGISPFYVALGAGGLGTLGFLVFLLIIIVIVVIVVIIVVFAVLAKIYSSKGRRRKLVKPNLQEAVFKIDLKPLGTPIPSQMRVLRFMEDMIVEYETNTVLEDLIAVLKPEEVDQFAKYLTYILIPLGPVKFQEVLHRLFQHELDDSLNAETLFRTNSLTTKLFARYARIVGSSFLWDALAYFIDDVFYRFDKKDEDEGEVVSMTAASMEIDPTKLGGEEDVTFLAANTYQLLLTLTNVFRRITQLTPQFPSPLGMFVRDVFDGVKEKYPGAEYKSVGGFIFLRWLCPAIFSPYFFGLCSKHPSPEASRMLVLVAKIIQNISNETFPGKKEKFMEKVDDFIRGNISVCHEFIDQISDTYDIDDEKMEREYKVEVPRIAHTNALIWFHNFLLEKPEFVEKYKDLEFLFGKNPEPIVS